MAETFYTGWGKVYFNAKSIYPEGENGAVKVDMQTKFSPFGSANQGRAGATFDEPMATVSLNPFDDWSLMGTLFPKYLGVSTGGAIVGGLKIQSRAHEAKFVTSEGTNTTAMVPATVWAGDGSSYAFVRAAITKHPDIYLGASKNLFGSMELTMLGDPSKAPGASGFLFNATPVVETGTAADPDSGTFSLANFVRQSWTGAYGGIAGGVVTPLTGFSGLEAQDFWTISVNAKYAPKTVQKVTRFMTLESVEVVAKCKLVGPTHTQLVAQLLNRAQGDRMSGLGYGLALTSSGGKVVTLQNCEVHGAGITIGGSEIRYGEVGFVTAYTYAAAVPDPILTIGA